ncbi:MAG: serine/threonine protein kinase, partial [Acidobacteria bacterium]|nr:serine/threonine protein kinase [Acidobacteriota bacterium]
MIGKIIGPYRVEAQLGAGGMGVVYRAHDTRLERDVALKFLSSGSATDPAAHARLLEEARTASALNHANICTIYDVGEADGQTYMAMEIVSGKPLSQQIPEGGMALEAVLRIGTQVAAALAHAHERNIVHRDLKSANVVITPEGQAKVLDFGLATRQSAQQLTELTRSQKSLEATQGLGGTLSYIAPELLRGDSATTRSDIWAFGVTLHEMASGELPFAGKTGFEISSGILQNPPSPLPARIPPGLRAIIQRCLSKEPAQRYQRGSEVFAALEAIRSSTDL